MENRSKESQPTQQFVEVQNIQQGILFLRNGGLRRVLMVSGINFDLKSEDEQGIITYAYQALLNTLDFSLQFIVHSRKLNIDGYLTTLVERQAQESNELLKNQISEYTEFIRSFVELNAVMAKTFFAVVPYDPIAIPEGGKKFFARFGLGKPPTPSGDAQNVAQHVVQLQQRTDQVISGLQQIGLRAVILEDEELIELFYNLYNPQAVEKRDLKIAHA